MTHPTLQQSIFNMISFHDGQLDKSQVPYFHHPLRVMIRLGPDADIHEKHAALLHDVIEDTPITLAILEDMGYCARVLDIVVLLTKMPNETHRSYVYRIIGSGNVGAMRVKLSDMYDNADIYRVERCVDLEVRKALRSMVESRYKPAIRMMKEVLGKNAESVIAEEIDVEIFEKEIQDATKID